MKSRRSCMPQNNAFRDSHKMTATELLREEKLKVLYRVPGTNCTGEWRCNCNSYSMRKPQTAKAKTRFRFPTPSQDPAVDSGSSYLEESSRHFSWCPINLLQWQECNTHPKGFVKSSEGLIIPGMWCATISPSSFQSWIAKYLISMCLVLTVGDWLSLMILIADWLSM